MSTTLQVAHTFLENKVMLLNANRPDARAHDVS
jgi:hypothetical protein